jgi:hypothetical protein
LQFLSTNPKAIHLLEQNPEKIDWCQLSLNVNAISLLEQNPDKIHWEHLSRNPNAIALLEQNVDKIDWFLLSFNPKAIHLIKDNLYDKIIYRCSWKNTHVSCYLFANPSIFEPDYQEMSKDRMKIIYQELMKRALHPSRMLQWIHDEEE